MLIVFSGMAAFTNNFDITSGLWGDGGELEEIARISTALNIASVSDIDASAHREGGLPILNSRGISLVMDLVVCF